MKLVNKQTKLPLVDFRESQVIFYNRFLEHEMEILGIAIPEGMRSYFNGKDYIFLGDEEFERAFKEVYYLTTIDPDVFGWQKS